MVMVTPTLQFRSYDTTEIGSISVLFALATPGQLCGIYILRFENGEAYVGQAVDVVTRYANHRRRWGDIVSLEFAPCSAPLLNECERRVVSQEEKTTSLRNLLLTGAPGGWGDVEVELESGGASVILPWQRDKRVTVAAEPTNSPLARFWRLAARSDYRNIRELLARYIHETIPDPVVTTHGMWTLAALPATKQSKSWRRLATVNCGRLETLFLGERTDDTGAAELVTTLNLAADAGEDALVALPLDWGNTVFISDHTYKAADVIPLQIVGLDALRSVLDCPEVLEAAYRLNVSQMRQGSKLFAKYHNAPFAYDVLAAIHEHHT